MGLWKSTSNHTNIQYDVFRNIKEVLKAIHDEDEDRLKNNLISQGSFFSNIIENVLSKANSVWFLAQGRHTKYHDLIRQVSSPKLSISAYQSVLWKYLISFRYVSWTC